MSEQEVFDYIYSVITREYLEKQNSEEREFRNHSKGYR